MEHIYTSESTRIFNEGTIISVSKNQLGKTDEIDKVSADSIYILINASVDLHIQNGIVKNGAVKLIMPPTLNEIVNKSISKNMINYKKIEGENLAALPTEIFFTQFDLTINREQNNTNINDTTIYMLGQTAKEKQELKDQIGIDWSTFTQVNIKE